MNSRPTAAPARRLAVLGSNSFAGATWVAHALTLGFDVLGVSRSPQPDATFLPYLSHARGDAFRFVQCDLRDTTRLSAQLADFAPAYVVDFAGQGMVAESWEAPHQWYETNVLAKVRLHDFLRQQTWLHKYVRISTPEVYGSREDLIKEGTPFNPSTPYAVSHAAVDLSLAAFYQHYRFPVVIGRFANFYGPHQQLYRIVPRAILCARLGQKLPLHGGGGAVRAFLHAADAARAIELLIERGQVGEVYHFSPERFVTIRELIDTLAAMLYVAPERLVEITPQRPAQDAAYRMDASRAVRELEWHDQVTLEQGLRETTAWIDRNLSALSALPLNYQHRP
ncbi:GDP-mannose 4,6-dehydratase [Burkholderia diffusa]|uniref:GDP-mannose 4,6-dehydratase n=1 Tax=Burkholderia diffusa TaxID=488732 RepID=UPI000755065A|nr:GDP-mannose 4,6-dehydratase [Burkholderia diffusa]KVN06952.1 dTDP-glucose 4,6-dehydratase [Burkholderia diffusa]